MFFCKICGRQLGKEGDICIDCYQGLIDEESQRDDKVLLKIKATFNMAYEILKTPILYFLVFSLIFFVIIASFQNSILNGLLNLVVYSGALILYFLIMKIRTESRIIYLYKTKLIYKRKFHLKNKFEVRYEDIEEIAFEDIENKKTQIYQSSWWLSKINKKYKMSELFFRIKKTDDSIFSLGFYIKPIYNFRIDIMPKLIKIMGFEERKEVQKSAIEEMLNIKKKDKDKEQDKNNKQ